MGKIASFIAGAAIGALAALAFAPNTGEQTRALVTEKANAFAGEAKDFASGMPGSAQDMYAQLRNQGSAVAKDAQAKTSSFVADASARVKEVTGKGAASEAVNDDLREKIEAARQRIAAQVMENAEQSKAVDVAAEAAEKVAEVVDEAAEAAEEVAEAVEEAVEAEKAE